MTTEQDEQVEVIEQVELARVNQQWPASVKDAVTEKVGKRGLTEFTLMAVRRQLDDGSADLAVEARDARDLAQRLANILATVVDREQRINALANMELPEWMNTKIWPDEVLERIEATVESDMHEEPTPDATVEQAQDSIQQTPELAKVQGEVTTVRVEEPKHRTASGLGTADEPTVIPEGQVNGMSGITYSEYHHIHSPEGRCLKNIFIEADAEGIKHCPLVEGRESTAPAAPPVTQSTGEPNLFERLKQQGALKPASEIPVPQKPPAEEALPQGDAPAPPADSVGTQAPSAGPQQPDILDDVDGDLEEIEQIAASPTGYGKSAETPGPESGPESCPNGCGPLDGGLCWTCGFAA